MLPMRRRGKPRQRDSTGQKRIVEKRKATLELKEVEAKKKAFQR